MSSIADTFNPEQLTDLMRAATQTRVVALPTMPANLVDAVCNDCGTDLRIAEPILGLVVCVDCATIRTQGKSGRRYVKAPVTPAGGMDLSKLTPTEIGEAVLQGVLRSSAARMIRTDRP